VRVRGGGVRRLALAVAALPVLVAGCGWPGSDQVAAAVRCVVRPRTPPPADAPQPAVWRTRSVPGAGYSIALPDNWDGVALGGSDPQEGGALTAVAERSPELVGELRQRASVGGAPATSLSVTTVLPSSLVHRLVLSAVGSRLHVWLDGRTVANAVTHVTQAGTAGIYLTTEDAAAHVFDVLRAGVYAAG
jgi:hypothetical protein